MGFDSSSSILFAVSCIYLNGGDIIKGPNRTPTSL